jgi:hypothetical protein
MSQGLTPSCQRVLLVLALAFWTAGTAVAQDVGKPGEDLQDQTRRRMEIAAQKVETEIRVALISAQTLAGKEPEKAVSVLEKALAQLNDDSDLSDARRETLKRLCRDQIRVVKLSADQAAKQEKDQADKEAKQQAEDDKRTAEENEIKRGVKAVRGASLDGKPDEAARRADDLASRFPNNKTVQTTQSVASTAQRMIDARRNKLDTERRIVGALRDVDSTAMLPKGDIEFPKDWAERVKNRTKPKLTQKEQAILDTLNSPITVSFDKSRFQDVIEYLQTVTGQSIIVDKHSLELATVSYDTLVSFNSRHEVAVRTVLRKILGELGLTYVIKDQTIQIVTAEEAKTMMTVRTYYLGDLVGAVDPTLGPVLGQLQMNQIAAQIIDMIVTSIDPDSWEGQGRSGLGTIKYDPVTKALIVKQTAEVHSMLGGSLR